MTARSAVDLEAVRARVAARRASGAPSAITFEMVRLQARTRLAREVQRDKARTPNVPGDTITARGRLERFAWRYAGATGLGVLRRLADLIGPLLAGELEAEGRAELERWARTWCHWGVAGDAELAQDLLEVLGVAPPPKPRPAEPRVPDELDDGAGDGPGGEE